MKTILVALICLSCACQCDDTALASGLAVAGARLAASGHVEQAKQTLYRALVYDDKCGSAYFELAKIADKDGDMREAQSLYRSAFIHSTDAAIKRQSELKYKALDPFAAKMLSALIDYARSLGAVAQAHQDVATLDKCSERIRDLDLESALPPESMPKLSAGNSINLLTLIRSSSVLPSTYTRTPNGILSPSTGKIKIQIPYAPPEAYEFIVEYRRIDEGGSVGLLVPVKGVWQLWYQELERCGFPGIPDFKPPVAVHGGDKCTLSMRVNGSHIDAFMNGRKLCSTDKPGQAYEWLLTNKLALGFGTQNCKVEFTSIRVVEMVGHGVVVR